MIEKALQEADGPLSIEGLKRKLPKKIMDQTLRLVLAYLANRGSIVIGSKGIVWIENNDPKFIKMIEKTAGIRL
ncbi:MAG: hypothetical protein V1887_02735 [Candidatus Aenigmatarchaeota archaeon]